MREGDLSVREKSRAFWRVATFKPRLTAFVIFLSVFVALLEGIGMTFLIPIIDAVQSPGEPPSEDGTVRAFLGVYEFLGVPFTLGFIILGVSAVMTVRFVSSFAVSWMRVALRIYYVRYLQTTALEHALNARVAYFDKHGSDDILNAIVTQSEYAGKVIRDFVHLMNYVFISIMYLAVAFYLAPWLTVLSGLTLGVLVIFIRNVLKPGYAVGDRVAESNERIQQSAQAATQGIRDIKLYTKGEDVFRSFTAAIEQFTDASIKLGRNEAAVSSFYNLAAALVVFGLIYVAITFTGLSIAELGVFLFAMFNLAPKISQANERLYKVEGRLPHLVRTQEFVRELERQWEPDSGNLSPPTPVTPISFEDVSFSYDTDEGSELVLQNVSFEIERGEYVAFVGQSGAGKSTIVSLVPRLYNPDSGTILSNDVPISDFDLTAWRKRVAVVRQDPFIFNDTLRNNVLIGNEEATDEAFEDACEVALITEFLDELPNGYDTVLGDDGVRLSGGQRQRVSLARALLKDADVLVLDEATSDLDTEIERQVQSAIESMDREYVIIAIAHRLSTVLNADQIYTLEDGEIVESGSHEKLIDEEGKYAQLYTTQWD